MVSFADGTIKIARLPLRSIKIDPMLQEHDDAATIYALLLLLI